MASVQAGIQGKQSVSTDVLGTIDARLIGLTSAAHYDSTDSLLNPTLKGNILNENDKTTIGHLALEAEHVSVQANGVLSAATADVKSEVRFSDLSQADARLTGLGQIDTQISGSLEKPHITINAALDKASALGQPIPHLAVGAGIDDPANLFKARHKP